MKKILVTGALGQIGTELTTKLCHVYGNENVISSDIHEYDRNQDKLYEKIDVTNGTQIYEVAKKYQVDTIIHLAALLSARAEASPQLAWNLNMNGLLNALEAANELQIKLFVPSSIATFGLTTPLDQTPQITVQRPTTMYGINKLAGELLCDYYHLRYGLDTRGIRLPGLISYAAPPGGGTTDYAVEMYYEAVKQQTYTSFIGENTHMDMMYMPDALDAIIQMMEADGNRLKYRNAYNISAVSAAPEDFAKSIQTYIPEFTLQYEVDPVRQQIAESWPNSLDYTAAMEDWGFQPTYNLDMMTKDMLDNLRLKLS